MPIPLTADVSTYASILAANQQIVDPLARLRVTGLDQAGVSHPGAVLVRGQHVPQRTSQELRQGDPEAARLALRGQVLLLSIDGPNLAAQAITAGLVDEYHLFVTTTVVGGGTRFFPVGIRLDLELVEHHAFANGLIHVRYRTP